MEDFFFQILWSSQNIRTLFQINNYDWQSLDKKKSLILLQIGGLVKPSPKSTVAPGESRRPISIPNRSNDSLNSPSVSAKSLSIQSDSPQRKRSIPPAASTVKKSESPTGMILLD